MNGRKAKTLRNQCPGNPLKKDMGYQGARMGETGGITAFSNNRSRRMYRHLKKQSFQKAS